MSAEDIRDPQAIPPADPLDVSSADDSLRLSFHTEGVATTPIEVKAISTHSADRTHSYRDVRHAMRVSEDAVEAEEVAADEEVTEVLNHRDIQTDVAVDGSTKAA